MRKWIKALVLCCFSSAAMAVINSTEKPTIMELVNNCGTPITYLPLTVLGCFMTDTTTICEKRTKIITCVSGFAYEAIQFTTCACSLCHYFNWKCFGC